MPVTIIFGIDEEVFVCIKASRSAKVHNNQLSTSAQQFITVRLDYMFRPINWSSSGPIIQGLSKRFERFKFGIYYVLIVKIRYNSTYK